MYKKYIYILFFIFFILGIIFFVGAEEQEYDCKYSGKIEQCLNNQKNYRSIEDFSCIQSSTENIIYQIILDEKFKELDEEIEAYLLELVNSKDYYFGPDKKENFTVAIDDIERILGEKGEYAFMYKNICSGGKGSILEEAFQCLGGTVSVSNVREFFMGSNSCESLYKLKLTIYMDTAYSILKINKKDVLKDEHKKFTKEQRTKYNELLEDMRINLGYIERMSNKWPSKTSNPH